MERLEEAFEAIVDQMEGKGELELQAHDIAAPSDAYVSDTLIIRKMPHDYGSFRIDGLVFIATKHVFRRLGLLLTATALQDVDSPISIALNRAESEIKAIFINKPSSSGHFNDFWAETRATSLYWSYRQLNKHPWDSTGRLPSDLYHLPHFGLTDQANGNDLYINYDERDYAVIGGNLESFAHLVELLLNISDAQSDGVEFVLEGEPGFRGVAPCSAEASFHLPGSIFWNLYGAEETN